jgi:Helicase conserved C-terminal domain/SNF2-related domain
VAYALRLSMSKPSVPTVLDVLTKARLVDIGKKFSVLVPEDATKREQVDGLLQAGTVRINELVRTLGRDELRAACRAHDLDDAGRGRIIFANRILEAVGEEDLVATPSFQRETSAYADPPKVGDIVRVRHREYLVEAVAPPPEHDHSTLVSMACLDDDDPGRELQVLWELELGARIIQPETGAVIEVSHIDPPRHFAAHLHAIKWNAVTASDAKLFQAPFRAGIKLIDHQLTPLLKALALPRANLFIADDVGLGKTIEAGLVLQELLLRQQVRFVLIVCPASICLQWRDEMDRRFGLQFEIFNRNFIARRRQERGFQVNPWSTHERFIISYQTLRRPEYRDPLLQHLGERAKKSLLILDEAHTAAPASSSKYAIDSRITEVIRDVAPRFVNRLFLSATPHNGHSNSFSALLEILDNQRFTRGVPIKDTKELEPVMVRRLKSDLRAIGITGFPERRVVQVDLDHRDGIWHGRFGEGETKPLHQAQIGPFELELSTRLAEYTELMRPAKGRSRLVFIGLQKRLLSSVEAFARTIAKHASNIGKGKSGYQIDLAATEEQTPLFDAIGLDPSDLDATEYGDDETQNAQDEHEAETLSRTIQTPAGRASQLLEEMVGLAQAHRAQPDAKVRALVAWIQQRFCSGAALDRPAGAKLSAADRRWDDQRLLIFTEYADTKRYLVQVLSGAIAGTDLADERIRQFHGGMSDEQREDIQQAFNGPPHEHPVRILVATDAAREGVNLQGYCADLFHFDVPWNPARMEQRNGRIDRTLQPADEVRCHYFVYTQRPSDLVLEKLVSKVDRIQRELGSLGDVVMKRLEKALQGGIGTETAEALDDASTVHDRERTSVEELESQRGNLDGLKKEIDDAGRVLNASRKVLDFDPALLVDALNVGFELAGQPPLKRLPGLSENLAKPGAFEVREMSPHWQRTLDKLRPPRRRDEEFWQWRKQPPQPVVFRPLEAVQSGLVQLHLQHALVRRVLGRFTSQGFSSHELSRVTIVRNPYDSIARVLAFGRLTLFGRGAVRLHDQLVSVAARWLESGGDAHLQPFGDEADRKALARLEELLAASPDLAHISEPVQDRLREAAPSDFDSLWQHVREQADQDAQEAEIGLGRRATEESAALRKILEGQRAKIKQELGARGGLLPFGESDKRERRQYQNESRSMEQRLLALEHELETEPQQIEELYEVSLSRLQPVGLVYLWPETRG